MSRPLVSVVIPTFNRRQLLEMSIDSVLAQTLSDFELFIVDDASTDGTADWLAKTANSDKRIHVIRLPTNRGCNVARNVAVGRARGSYLAFLDDDDLFLPERLEHTVAKFEAAPELGVVFSQFGFINIDGDVLPWTPKFLPVGESATPGAQVFSMLYCDWGWIPTCTLTVRAEWLTRLPYLEIRRSDNDAILNAQLAASGAPFAQVPRRLAFIRRDPSHSSMSKDRKALLADRRESLSLLRNWLREREITEFNRLHSRAQSNQLMNEAEFFGHETTDLPIFRASTSYWDHFRGYCFVATDFIKKLFLPKWIEWAVSNSCAPGSVR
jgi:glycosyltransferase involved in cell wall biosynthesis